MEISDLRSLEELAIELGASDAKVMPADRIVVEDRVRLKCMAGCPSYGTCLKCPPFVPSPEEFRKMLGGYRYAMIVKLMPPEMPDGAGTAKDRMEKSGTDSGAYYKKNLTVMTGLEKGAFDRGLALATALFGGRCLLCERCNTEKGICLNPTMARIAAEAVGVNVMKTAENAGMTVKFPVRTPEPIGILLID
jgi:predicted metal-binding protein